MPAPKLFNNLPDGSNSRTVGRFESAQPFAPQRSNTQIFPSGLISIPSVAPHFRPSGNCAQPVVVLYGFGKSFEGAELCWACAVTTTPSSTVAHSTARPATLPADSNNFGCSGMVILSRPYPHS